MIDRTLSARFFVMLGSLAWALCSVVPAWPQSAASTSPVDLAQLVQSAQTIVRGRVISAKVEPHPQFSNLRTVVITMAVTRQLKGQSTSTLTFRQFLWDAQEASIFAGYKGAGELLLFLNPVSPYGLTSPVGLEQGRFRVLRDAKGNSYVLNGRRNLGLFTESTADAGSHGVIYSRRVREMMATRGVQVPLDSFEEAIQTLSGASR
jgi:hypothetical protein